MIDNHYDGYTPIPAENLPSCYLGCFRLLDTTFTPANDRTIIRTITGHNLELVCDGQDDGKHVKTPVTHAGYQKAIWELREGHLRYCPSQDRLWRRDADETDHDGPRLLLNSWHPIKTIEDEYGIGTTGRNADRNPAMSATILREAKRIRWFVQVERGVRIDPCVWIRQNGHVVRLRNEDDIAVTQTFDPKGMGNAAIDQAWRIVRWLTVDEPSARNLMRMFATPWLEPFKQLSYVLSGHGGDGKTLIMRQAVLGVLGLNRVFPGFSVVQYCSNGGYTLGRESMNDAMDGKAFAYDDESCEVTEPMLPYLRALSTGSQMQARTQGSKYRTVTPTATMVMLTNMPFADSTENSDRRRFAKVEMHPSNGRSYDQYHAIELFCRRHPGAFYAASCRLWEEGDEPDLVNLSPARSITDEMYWLISEILTNTEKYGQPIASREDYRREFHTPVPASLIDLFGLKNSTTAVFGGRQRVVRVVDKARFDVYRKAVDDGLDDEPQTDMHATALTMTSREDLTPVKGADRCRDAAMLVERACAGRVGFAPCEGKVKKEGMFDEKVSLSWKRLNPDLEHRRTADTVRLDQTRYCVPPLGDVFVVDCDASKTDGEPHGFQLLQAMTGRYGTQALPSTLAVRSPHGVHLYYRTPTDYPIGRLKNAVHPEDIPIDLRVSGKGYVLGPGSTANGGRYELVDLPADGGTIPEASRELMRFLETHEYTSRPAAPSVPARPTASTMLDLDSVMRDLDRPVSRDGGRPDMTPVPEGQRNQVLHDWAWGRLKNHPENRRRIEQDLYERGRLSGLRDPELATIWGSITRSLEGGDR